MDLRLLAKGAGALIRKNSPHILTAVGIASYISAIVMAAKAAPIAKPELDHALELRKEAIEADESKTDATADCTKYIVDNVAPLYLGTVGMAVLGTACVIAADKVHTKRQTALMAAYTISEKALDVYQEKVIKRLGEKKHEAVMDDIATDEEPFAKKPDKIEVLDSEGVLCYDHVTGRYFKSSIENVRSAESAVVKRLLDETMVSLNEFYAELGLNDVSVIGDALGWDATRTGLDIHFTSMLDNDGVPCLVLNYRTCVVNSGLLYC